MHMYHATDWPTNSPCHTCMYHISMYLHNTFLNIWLSSKQGKVLSHQVTRSNSPLNISRVPHARALAADWLTYLQCLAIVHVHVYTHVHMHMHMYIHVHVASHVPKLKKHTYAHSHWLIHIVHGWLFSQLQSVYLAEAYLQAKSHIACMGDVECTSDREWNAVIWRPSRQIGIPNVWTNN